MEAYPRKAFALSLAIPAFRTGQSESRKSRKSEAQGRKADPLEPEPVWEPDRMEAQGLGFFEQAVFHQEAVESGAGESEQACCLGFVALGLPNRPPN